MRKNDLLTEKVIQAESYRLFIREALDILRQKRRGFSLTTFAQKAGLGSRGFILDVINGKKRLTARSAPKVIKGLGLDGKLKNLFLALIDQAEPDLSLSFTSPNEREARIARMKAELISQVKQESSVDRISAASLYGDINFLMVYSALGSIESGATLEQICARSNLSKRIVLPILEKMQIEKILQVDGFQYKAINSHIVFEKLGNNQEFKNVFLETLKIVRERAVEGMQRENELFFHSVVSINKNQLPELKSVLRTRVTEFVHENQFDDGDHVAIVQLAFF